MMLKVLVVSLTVLASGLAAAAKEHPTQEPKSAFDGAVENARAAASELIVQAMGLLGVNYKYGGETPETGFDCSGFVSHVFKEAAGVILPHSAYQMSLVGQKVPSSELQPGDLVFYHTLKRAFSHVGIYVGDNKFIHAPSRGKSVEIANMNDSYWTRRYQGARRVTQLEQVDEAAVPTAQPDPIKAELSAVLY